MTALSTEEEAAEAASRRLDVAAATAQSVPASSSSRSAASAVATPAVSVAAASAAFVPPPCPTILLDLAIVDEASALEQCQDWSFFHELLSDMVMDSERDRIFRDFDRAIAENNHYLFFNQADEVHGSAYNLHLTALMDAGQKTWDIAIQLHHHPDLAASPVFSEYLAARRPFVDQLRVEYDRLASVLPRYAALAAEEAAYEAEQEERQAAEDEAADVAAQIAAEIEARAVPPSSNQLSLQNNGNGAT
jgi:phage terminase large subunit-like protein